MPFVPINAPGLYPSMMRILKRNGTYFLLKRWALSIPLATTQCQSLRQTTFTSIKIILCPDSAPLLITFFSSVATLTQSSFALNASVSFFSNIKSASDSKNLTFSKVELDISDMTSPKRGTAALNQDSTLSMTGYYPLQGNPYSPSLV